MLEHERYPSGIRGMRAFGSEYKSPLRRCPEFTKPKIWNPASLPPPTVLAQYYRRQNTSVAVRSVPEIGRKIDHAAPQNIQYSFVSAGGSKFSFRSKLTLKSLTRVQGRNEIIMGEGRDTE